MPARLLVQRRPVKRQAVWGPAMVRSKSNGKFGRAVLAIAVFLTTHQNAVAAPGSGHESGLNIRLVAQYPVAQRIGPNESSVYTVPGSLKWLSNGNYVVSWDLCMPPNYTCNSRAQVFDSQLSAVSSQISFPQSSWIPSLASLPNGAFTAIWNTAVNAVVAENSAVVLAGSFQNDGAPIGGPTVIATSPPLTHFGSAASTSQGALLVFKKSADSAIHGAIVSGDGAVSTSFFITSTSGSEWRPSLAGLTPDLVALTWGQFNNGPSYGVLLAGC